MNIYFCNKEGIPINYFSIEYKLNENIKNNKKHNKIDDIFDDKINIKLYKNKNSESIFEDKFIKSLENSMKNIFDAAFYLIHEWYKIKNNEEICIIK